MPRRAVFALALSLLLAIEQTGAAVAAAMVQPVMAGTMAPCPDCDDAAASPQGPTGGDAMQCLAHCASEAQAATASPLVIPVAAPQRARAPRSNWPAAAQATQLVSPGHPPPKRILHQSFQI